MTPIDYWLSDFKHNWGAFFNKKSNILEMVITLAFFYFISYMFKINLVWLESIKGVQLNDLFINWIPAQDVSVYVFVVLYWVVFYTYILLLAYPKLLKFTFQFYIICLTIRLLMIYFVNLEPPINLVFLEDPILNSTTYSGYKITKDLFFSGHAVSILVCYFVMPNHFIKRVIFILTFVLFLFLLMQHIHYTIDIAGAYIVVLLIYKVFYIKKIQNISDKYQHSKQIIN
jgi:hypothetical protein